VNDAADTPPSTRTSHPSLYQHHLIRQLFPSFIARRTVLPMPRLRYLIQLGRFQSVSLTCLATALTRVRSPQIIALSLHLAIEFARWRFAPVSFTAAPGSFRSTRLSARNRFVRQRTTTAEHAHITVLRETGLITNSLPTVAVRCSCWQFVVQNRPLPTFRPARWACPVRRANSSVSNNYRLYSHRVD
jgi:hypothetical protein